MNVAFYSFKGGVGRSLALAHAAWLLAARSAEQRILAVDLDLEAPGLDCYFRFPGMDKCRGFAGLLCDYQQQPEAERADWLRRMLTDESSRYVVKSQGDGKLGNLWYLPSGLGQRDAQRVSYQQVTAIGAFDVPCGPNISADVGAVTGVRTGDVPVSEPANQRS